MTRKPAGTWRLAPGGFAGSEAVQSFCLRFGLVGGAIWLALPQLQRVPAWVLWSLFAAAVAVVIRPRLAIWLIPLLLLLVWLRPRSGTKNQGSRPRE